jgi:peptidoglycan/xylan/chitin deacetylase (PgdA/CDA1 family)
VRPAVEVLTRTWSRWPRPRQPVAQILGYHRIDNDGGGLCVSPATFARQMRLLDEARDECAPMRLGDLLEHLDLGQTRPWSAAVTFDDGWADNHTYALGPLVEHRIPAIVYVPSRFLGSPGYLTETQVREMLAAGIEIGSHTRTHPDLRACTPVELQSELQGSKEDLEDTFGVEITSFAYPTGLWNEAAREGVAAAGYRSAVSTRRGWAQADSDALCLPRNFVEDFDDRTFVAALRGGLNLLGWIESLRGLLGPR